MLEEHNKYREQHGVQLLTLNDDLTQQAQAWAEHMLETEEFEHGGTYGMGQNLFFSDCYIPSRLHPATPVRAWYSEIKKYDFDNPGFRTGIGHFTQVVWAATTKIGVGIAGDEDKSYVAVHYSPAGNGGGFRENVLPPQ